MATLIDMVTGNCIVVVESRENSEHDGFCYDSSNNPYFKSVEEAKSFVTGIQPEFSNAIYKIYELKEIQ